jgi:hypothetical protein
MLMKANVVLVNECMTVISKMQFDYPAVGRSTNSRQLILSTDRYAVLRIKVLGVCQLFESQPVRCCLHAPALHV